MSPKAFRENQTICFQEGEGRGKTEFYFQGLRDARARETFTVTLRYDNTQVGSPQTVDNLQPGTSQTLAFIWDTTGVALGTYYVSAVASPVPGETDTSDNSCTSTTIVTVTSPPPPGPIGGVWVSSDKVALLAPWIGYALLIIVVAISMACVRSRKGAKRNSSRD